VLNRDHLKSMHLAFVIANRDIFTRPENVRAETVTAFVISIGGLVVVEHPASVLLTAGLVDKQAVFILLTFPKSSDTAMIPVLLPDLGIDMTIAVERRHEFVSMSRGALGELLGASEIEPDAFECVRQGSHGLVSLMPIMPPVTPRSARIRMPWIWPAIPLMPAPQSKALR